MAADEARSIARAELRKVIPNRTYRYPADSDEAGHAFQSEAGRYSELKSARYSDAKPATWGVARAGRLG